MNTWKLSLIQSFCNNFYQQIRSIPRWATHSPTLWDDWNWKGDIWNQTKYFQCVSVEKQLIWAGCFFIVQDPIYISGCLVSWAPVLNRRVIMATQRPHFENCCLFHQEKTSASKINLVYYYYYFVWIGPTTTSMPLKYLIYMWTPEFRYRWSMWTTLSLIFFLFTQA